MHPKVSSISGLFIFRSGEYVWIKISVVGETGPTRPRRVKAAKAVALRKKNRN
ncbi:hypothetical protein BH23BAC1_BH23BAC1_43100 [soil metagenome]